jgi:DNA sulfur modification protein DndD
MKLHKLSARNFMPYKGEMEITFPTDDYRNVMIVFGDNMRGKTSLLNAIRWGFYGRAIGRHSRLIPLNAIVNRDAALEDDWTVEVFLTFEVDGAMYELRRRATRKTYVAIPTRNEDFDIQTYLTRDGIVVSGDQVEAEINQAAPEQVSRFFLFDGELLQEYEELLIEGSDQGRQIKDAIEQVLGVPSLTNGRTQLGAILKAATKNQSRDMEKIRGLEQQAEQTRQLTNKLDSYENDLTTLQEKLDVTREERMKLDDDLESAARVLALQAVLDNAKTSFIEHTDTLKRKRTERHRLLAIAWQDVLDVKLDAKRSVLQGQMRRLTDGLKARATLESKVDGLRQLLDKKECPTCHQPHHIEGRDHLGAELRGFESELALLGDTSSGIQGISVQLATLAKIKSNSARERLTQIDRDIRIAEVGAQRAENDIERYEEEIAGADTAEMSRKRGVRDQKLKEEGRLGGSIKAVKVDIQKANEDLAVTRKAIEGLASARSQSSTTKVTIAANLEKVFSTSVEALRDKLRQKVETLASDSFLKMTTQKAYQGLAINNNYGLSIKDSSGRTVSLRSAGAEQIVALSLIDGLNRTGRAIGPVVMDTPFARLDPKHRINVLNYLPTVTSQFILLVHGGEITPETDLAMVRSRIGAVYRIQEISETQSRVERTQL